MQPLVSIIMPSFNSARSIAESVQSVIDQSFSNWELIICDDCSQDETVSLALKIAESEERIVIISNDVNSGPAVARNNALRMARGRFIAFLDSDDLWFDNFLEAQLEFLAATSANFVFSGYEIFYDGIDRNKSYFMPTADATFDGILKQCQISCLTAIYDSKIIGKMPMPNYGREDLGCWLNILKKTEKAYCNRQILAAYRIRPGSVSRNKLKIMHEQWQTIRGAANLGIVRSCFYISIWAWKGIVKYHFSR
ncbi:hypothetical protein IDSA_01055 [Pseudidiomarina salinarum]|uniref:Glycosyltransferase 2-like domain-containing protein n=1 Tax=Pseudidiomarina salinarum TaxID=435908 RepID=A0A094IW89_9GAMM|nr:glycosyltransferase family 2 protein [Pseudidiomarina salinarum]KFZ31347.1 hypothetical protein IDSA_01055 [Pseudidiomarina salinarum]RUO70894.1 glycosyltransferase family 2 protein [Pseudidiomarina salinarum]